MNHETLSILNSRELIDVREYHMDRLTRLFNGEVFDEPFFLSGYGGWGQSDPTKEPEKWTDEALTNLAHTIENNYEKILAKKTFYPLTVSSSIYGVHFTDRLFGANISFESDLWWSSGVDNKIGELPVPDLEHNETWKQAQNLVLAFVDSGVKLPFTETTVLGEPWNQTINLYKEDGLMAFYDNPKAIKRDLTVVADTLVEMHKWFIKTIPAEQFQPICSCGRCQPRGFGQMCGCSTHLISNEIYEEFVREEDEKILNLYPNGCMYHLCGHHTQHIPSWMNMPKVRAFQTNDLATDLFPEFYKSSRPDQIFYINFTEKVDMKKVYEISDGGKRCVFVSEYTENYK